MRRGFTLLEVMISLAILAVGLVAVGSLNGGAVAMHAYGRRATEATLLLRSKMLDVEDDLQKNGFSDFNDAKHGDFSDDGAPGYAWSAEILKPDVQLDPSQLLNLVGGNLVGGNVGQGTAASATAPTTSSPTPAGAGGPASLLSGPLSGVLQAQAKTFVETLKKSVREIRLTVSWPDGNDRRSVSASQVVVILPQTVGQTPNVPGQPAPQGLQNPANPLQPQNPAPGQRPGIQQ
jgi:general secretion pathway protein I